MIIRRQVFLLSLAIGILIAIIPLILKPRRDPFDTVGSYAIWWIGFFVVSTIMSFREPSHAKRVAQGIGLGLPAALIRYFVVTPESANLWPLSLIVGGCGGNAACVCRRLLWKARRSRRGWAFSGLRDRRLSHRSVRRDVPGGERCFQRP
jgi:hypothetical protein